MYRGRPAPDQHRGNRARPLPASLAASTTLFAAEKQGGRDTQTAPKPDNSAEEGLKTATSSMHCTTTAHCARLKPGAFRAVTQGLLRAAQKRGCTKKRIRPPTLYRGIPRPSRQGPLKDPPTSSLPRIAQHQQRHPLGFSSTGNAVVTLVLLQSRDIKKRVWEEHWGGHPASLPAPPNPSCAPDPLPPGASKFAASNRGQKLRQRAALGFPTPTAS